MEGKYELSIIIPVYNNNRIGKAIKSVVTNCNKNVELMVIDGGSSDDTLEEIKKNREYINVFVSEPDNGINDAINKGIKMSSGEWIFVLAADDILVCNPLKIIEKANESDVICGSIIIPYEDKGYYIHKSERDLNKLKLCCSLRHPASFFKKELFNKYGYYNENINIAGDRELFFRLWKKDVNFNIIDDIVTLFSIQGVSSTNAIKKANIEDIKISDMYNVNKIVTRGYYIKRCIRYYVGYFIKKIGMRKEKEYYTQEELEEKGIKFL